MVARTNPNSKFVVTLWRDGEIRDSRTAATGGRALQAAILMLAQLDELQDSDKLTVTEG